MKVAKLPTGNVLEFPDETSDEAIDDAVQRHLKGHIEKKKAEVDKQKQTEDENKKRHDDIIFLLTNLIKSNIALNEALLKKLDGLHKEHMKILDKISKPKKRRVLRDDKGKLVGAEEYV